MIVATNFDNDMNESSISSIILMNEKNKINIQINRQQNMEYYYSKMRTTCYKSQQLEAKSQMILTMKATHNCKTQSDSYVPRWVLCA